MPVRTSPVPAVASDGCAVAPRRARPRAARRRACRRPSAARPQPNSEAARRTASRRCASISSRVGAEQPRELAAVRRQHASAPARANGLELPERVRVEHDRQLEPLEQRRARARACPSLRPRPGPIATASARSAASSTASAARGSSAAGRVLGQRPLDRLEQRATRARAAPTRARRARRSPRRRGTPRARVSIGAPVSPREPPTTSTEPARYFVLARCLRGTSSEHRRRRRAQCSCSAAPSPIGATCTAPGVEAAGRDREPDLRRAERDRHGRAHRRARHLAGRRVDAGGHVDRDDGLPARVDPLDHARGVLARRVREADAEQRVDDHVGLAEVADAVDDA